MHRHEITLLIEKYALGAITPAEQAQLMKWFREEGNQEAEWINNESEESVRDRMLLKLQQHITAQPPRLFQLSFAKIAAAVVVGVGLAVFGYYFTGKGLQQEMYTVTNPHGKVQVVHLPDNSRVWLNAATTLKYRKSFKDHRELELDGEAFFEVTKDPENAFSIKTGDITTTVLGTSFNVSAHRDVEVKTISVVTGRVKVGDETKDLATLTPSKMLRYHSQTKNVAVIDADINSILSWKRGKLEYDGLSLVEIARGLQRWYGYSFTFNNSALEKCRYYLNIDNSVTIDEAMKVLSEVAGVQANIDHNNKSISIKGTSCQ